MIDLFVIICFLKREREIQHIFLIYVVLINYLNLGETRLEHFTRLPFLKHTDLFLFVFVFVCFTLGALDFRGHVTRLPFFQHMGSIKPGISKRVE
jgi:hypothetical protein